MKNKIPKYLFFILGCLIMGFGIAICEQANLGVDPMSVLVLGAYKRFHVSFGTMNFIIGLLQLCFSYLTEKKNVTLATLLAMIFTSIGIDLFEIIPFSSTSMMICFIWLALGLILYCFGVAMSEVPSVGYTAYDGVIFGIQKYTHLKYYKISWIVNFVYLIVGYLLGGTVGIGTLLILLLAGKIIEYFAQILRRKIVWH